MFVACLCASVCDASRSEDASKRDRLEVLQFNKNYEQLPENIKNQWSTLRTREANADFFNKLYERTADRKVQAEVGQPALHGQSWLGNVGSINLVCYFAE
eukprot:996513-Alexandrium_andersonii.AAC.1